MTVELVIWLGTAVAAASAAVASVLARSSPVLRAVPAVLVLAVVVCSGAFHLRPAAPSPGVASVTASTIVALGVVAGSAVTSAVLSLAVRPTEIEGPHGGIVVPSDEDTDDGMPDEDGASGHASGQSTGAPAAASEVLRGGAAIGYLERSALIGAALVGHLEVLAVVIAVKGLGRFTELDTAEARERFIIGTLASTLWAGCAAAAVLLP